MVWIIFHPKERSSEPVVHNIDRLNVIRICVKYICITLFSFFVCVCVSFSQFPYHDARTILQLTADAWLNLGRIILTRCHEKPKDPRRLNHTESWHIDHSQAGFCNTCHTTAWNHAHLFYWCECGTAIYKTTHATVLPLDRPKWPTRLSHFGTTVLFQYLYNSEVSQCGFFMLMDPAASTLTKKSGFILLVKLSANFLPMSTHSISLPAGWHCSGVFSPLIQRVCLSCFLTVCFALVRNLTRKAVAQGTAICEVQMQHFALALIIPLFDLCQVINHVAQQSTQIVSWFDWSLEA